MFFLTLILRLRLRVLATAQPVVLADARDPVRRNALPDVWRDALNRALWIVPFRAVVKTIVLLVVHPKAAKLMPNLMTLASQIVSLTAQAAVQVVVSPTAQAAARPNVLEIARLGVKVVALKGVLLSAW